MTNIAMDNDPFIDGLPILNMVIFHGYVSHNQMDPDGTFGAGHGESYINYYGLSRRPVLKKTAAMDPSVSSLTSLQLRGCRWGWQELHAPGCHFSHMAMGQMGCQNFFTPKCGWFNMVQYGLIYIYIYIILIPNTYMFRCF